MDIRLKKHVCFDSWLCMSGTASSPISLPSWCDTTGAPDWEPQPSNGQSPRFLLWQSKAIERIHQLLVHIYTASTFEVAYVYGTIQELKFKRNIDHFGSIVLFLLVTMSHRQQMQGNSNAEAFLPKPKKRTHFKKSHGCMCSKGYWVDSFAFVIL